MSALITALRELIACSTLNKNGLYGSNFLSSALGPRMAGLGGLALHLQ